MKKIYNKPILNIESFALSQTVAANCGAAHTSPSGGPLQASSSTCAYNIGGVPTWTTEVQACVAKADANAEFSGVCYNAPDGGNNIFNS